MRPRLKLLLTVSFTLLAIVPVFFLGLWVEQTAYDREFAAVRQKHLLLANNITAALERYQRDTRAAFGFFIEIGADGGTFAGLPKLAGQLGIRHFCIIDANGRIVREVRARGYAANGFSAPIIGKLGKNAGLRTRLTGVMADGTGRPTIYLHRRLGDGRLAVAALDTSYIRSLQRAITFGRKGHAAIVDQYGTIIAHPNDTWVRQMKSIARVKPVKAMIKGQSGVTSFYSPAIKKQMVTGFTTVPGVGWGVMVPQPLGEIEERAREVALVALAIALAGLALAALIAWFLAGLMVRPLQAVLATARQIAGGGAEARVRHESAVTPAEFVELSNGFNAMAGQLQADQQMMSDALDEAERANRAKTDFLANMSHELRTPLNAIIGFSQLIKREIHGPVGDKHYTDYANDIDNSGKHLLQIINDILDLSKIEAGEIKVEDAEVDLRTAVSDAMVLVKGGARDGEVRIALELADRLPKVRGSAIRITQVLANLISNAIKFTPAGGSVTISADAETDGAMAIRVADTGIGMTEEEIEVALTPFGQVDAKLERKYEGTGLGLPLSRRLVELHDGELSIESRPGEGTTVTVRLPAERVCSKAA